MTPGGTILVPTVVDTYAKPLVHYWPRTTYVLNWQNCIGINVRTWPLLRPCVLSINFQYWHIRHFTQDSRVI